MSSELCSGFSTVDLTGPSEEKPNLTVKITDRFNIHKLAFIVYGITSTLPLTVLPTPTNYWMYKFRDVEVQYEVGSHTNKTVLQTFFFGYLFIASSLPNVFAMLFCTFIGYRISQHLRNTFTLLGMFGVLLATTAFVYINSDNDQMAFLWFTLATAVALNVLGAVFQGTIVSFAAQFPAEYTHGLVSAQSLSGLLVVVMEILILLTNVSILQGGFLLFLVSDLIVLICFILYIFTRKTRFSRKYQTKSDSGQKSTSISLLTRSIKHVWIPALSGLIVLGQTVAIMPPTMLVVPKVPNSSVWTGKIFVQCWNLFPLYLSDFVGRKIAGYFPLKNNALLLCLSVLRTGFMPILLLCNLQPRTTLPVLFENEVYFVLIFVVFCLCGGYLGAIPMFASNSAPAELRETVTFVVITANVLGGACGSFLSVLLIKLL